MGESPLLHPELDRGHRIRTGDRKMLLLGFLDEEAPDLEFCLGGRARSRIHQALDVGRSGLVFGFGFYDLGNRGRSDGLGIDVIAVGMGTDKADEDDSRVVMDFDDEPVIVAFDVEDDAVARQNVRGRKVLFDRVEIP